MDSDFLFIAELSPSQSWLDSITLGPEGTIELKRFSRELKCYAAIEQRGLIQGWTEGRVRADWGPSQGQGHSQSRWVIKY